MKGLEVKLAPAPAAAPAVKPGSPLGVASAIIATFGVVDKDGDVTLPGAFTDGAEVVVSQYNHSSQIGTSLPVGKGRIRTTAAEAIVDVQFNMLTQAGRETFEVVRDLGAIGEWSYGYKVVNAEMGNFGGQRVQFLKALQVFEVSPVLRGAGINTGTVPDSAKEEAARQFLRFVRSQLGLAPKPADVRSADQPDDARDLAAVEYARFVRSGLAAS
jgi:hypothetical protein